MTDIITGPGLYVLRNGDFVAIVRKNSIQCRNATMDYWLISGHARHDFNETPYDIIRRATPEEAARFCGDGGDD